MIGVFASRLGNAISLSNSLADELTAENLRAHNANGRSNTIGGQFWCLVGGRESTARAIEAGIWGGFTSSLTDIDTPDLVRSALGSSSAAVAEVIASTELDEPRQKLALGLLEHEAMHHGQLIRFFYANDLAFPDRFARRYSLT